MKGINTMSGQKLRNNITLILEKYCRMRVYIVFKPTFYALTRRYLDKLANVCPDADEIDVLNTVVGLYKKLIAKKSERLATSVGIELAKYLKLNPESYLAYRESKIWTQRYIKGLGPFESQVYHQDHNKIHSKIEFDPVYIQFIQLKNQLELSKVMHHESRLIAKA